MTAFPPVLVRFATAADTACRNGRGPLNLPCRGDWHWTCYLPLLIPFVLIPVTWTLSFYLAARMSGWIELAAKYVAARMPDGDLFTWQSMGTFRMGGYNNCIRFVVSEKGLYIAVQRPFGSFHDPLLIPWHDLVWVADKKVWGFAYSEFRMPLRDGRVWRFPGKIVKAARERGYLPPPGAPAQGGGKT